MLRQWLFGAYFIGPHGAGMEFAPSERAVLERFEGSGAGSESSSVRGKLVSETVFALTYVATKERLGLRPHHLDRQHVLVGAEEANLPADDVRAIEAVSSIDDPDTSSGG
jgi:hypothetical protein